MAITINHCTAIGDKTNFPYLMYCVKEQHLLYMLKALRKCLEGAFNLRVFEQRTEFYDDENTGTYCTRRNGSLVGQCIEIYSENDF